MLLHDILHSFTICLRLSIIYSLNRLNAGENGNNLNENLIQQEIQLSERNGAELPQQQNENEPPAPNQPNRRLNRSQTSRTLQIMENKERAAKLMTFCT